MTEFKLACPAPAPDSTVTLAHGAGGRAMHKLIKDVFHCAFADPALEDGHDGAALYFGPGKLAFTTDSFVVSPLFFPGGDIGSLAVHGTVNDLAMCGAEPLYLSCGFILEEGLSFETLRDVARSMARAAKEAGARIVTGDTKVVERGKGDKLYVNTAGVGRIVSDRPIGPIEVKPGDAILISGGVGEHGAAVLSERESLKFETTLRSDSACVWPEVKALLSAGSAVHCLRDLTRGGLATALNEIAQKAAVCIRVDEDAIPVRPEVQGACEVFGLDPLYMACEGRFIAFVPAGAATASLEVLKKATGGRGALIGHVSAPTNRDPRR